MGNIEVLLIRDGSRVVATSKALHLGCCSSPRSASAHDICNLSYKIPKEIPVMFHNGSTYNYHFIIKELAEEFEGEFKCLGENTEKYIEIQCQSKRKLQKKIRMAMIRLWQ